MRTRIRTRIRTYKKPLNAAPTPRVMLGVGMLVGALFVWMMQSDAPERRGAAAPDGLAPAAALRHAAAAQPQQPQRLVYRYSVIPGGVASRTALAGAVLRDPVVAAHYARFDVAHARVVKLDAPQWKHVSYRVGDKVYWTSKKVMLAAGEAVITDGAITARTRCGNQVSDVPMQPVMMANEPAPEALDVMYASAEGIGDAAAEVPIGQGAAPRAVELPTVQTAAVSGTIPGRRAGMPLLASLPAPQGLNPVRIQSAPPIVLHGVIVTPPVTPPPVTPPPVTPPPSNPTPPKPTPPTPTPPTPTPPTPTPQDPPKPGPAPSPTPPASFVPPRTRTPVPEPGTISLTAGALAAMVLLRRKKWGQVRRT